MAVAIVCIVLAVGASDILSTVPGVAFLGDEDFTWDVMVGILGAHWIMLRWLDRRPWGYVGMARGHATPALLGQGSLVGILSIGIPALLLVALSQLKPVATPDGSSFGAGLAAAATLFPAAFEEELLMRGYIFAVIRESVGWKLALISTSTIFGLMHMGNPGADALSILLVTLAGFFLGGVLLATGSLFAVTMAHFTWNWTMAALLHTPVSGIQVATPDYRIIDAGPDWLTGGQWGPEGGVAAAAGMFTAFFYLYARRIRRLES